MTQDLLDELLKLMAALERAGFTAVEQDASDVVRALSPTGVRVHITVEPSTMPRVQW